MGVEPVDERREAAAGRVLGVDERREEEVMVRGAPMEGGAVGFVVVVGVALGVGEGEGLSHEEKKSSLGAGWGVLAPRGVNSRPSMWIPWGFLRVISGG